MRLANLRRVDFRTAHPTTDSDECTFNCKVSLTPLLKPPYNAHTMLPQTKRSLLRGHPRWLGTVFSLILLVGPAVRPVSAQIIGSSKPLTTPAEDETDKVTSLLSKLAEQLTTQRLNLKKISCDEQVALERFPVKGKPGTPITQSFKLTGERKSTDDFSAESTFVETHTALGSEAGNSASPGGSAIDDSLLVKDSLSAAEEFMGMSHREIYAQRFVRKDKMNNRPAYVISFQTTKSLEERRITIAGKSVPMRLSGTAWIDAANGNVLRIQVHQTKLPKGVRELSYDIEYPLPTSPTSFMLPRQVRFTRTMNQETVIVVQQISNCRVN